MSTLNDLVTVELLPAASLPETVKEWLPSLSAEYCFGEVQAEADAESSLQVKVVAGSDELNVAARVFDGTAAPARGFETVIAGGVVSITNVAVAGVESTIIATTARTLKVWEPSAREGVVYGVLHAAQLPASILHWNDARRLFDLNLNVGLLTLVGLVGPDVIVVSSGAAVALPAPSASIATTQIASASVRARA